MGIWKVVLERAEVILKGLADREDEIFRKRREAEERQDRAEKRRRIHAENQVGGTHMQNGHDYVPVRPLPPSRPSESIPLIAASSPSTAPSIPGLPARPAFVVPPTADNAKEVATLVGGSNSSIVANRKAIRMANLSAADLIKAEMASGNVAIREPEPVDAAKEKNASAAAKLKAELLGGIGEEEDVDVEMEESVVVEEKVEEPVVVEEKDGEEITSPRGKKRKADEDGDSSEGPDGEETNGESDEVDSFLASAVTTPGKVRPAPIKLLGNNMAEQEDTVKL
ncbi:hypothetical protein T439DRAFT_94877 [Meredithblackwellia eburnea MCA 4105]